MLIGRKALLLYCISIWNILPCPLNVKRHAVYSVWEKGKMFLLENHKAKYQEFVSRFGIPVQIAEEYIAETNAAELLKKLHIRQCFLRIIGTALAICVLLWGIAVGSALLVHIDESRGYDEVYVEVEARYETQ